MEFTQDQLNRQTVKVTLTKAQDTADGQFEAVLSTADLDRHGERVSITGMTVPKGRVMKMYYNHETNGMNLPIGKWLKVWKSAGVLKGQGQIDMEDDFAVKVYKKIKNGFIDSISVGFYPQEFDGETSTWTRSELVEASVVAEPANINAVITSKLGFTEDEFNRSLKVKLKEAKGLDADVEEVDEDEESEDNPNSEILSTGDISKTTTSTTNSAFGWTAGTTTLTPSYTISKDGADISELKAAFEDLKSKFGALEAAVKASSEKPAMKTLLIKARTAGKEVDKTAEELNKVLRVKLKGH
jgi:HK97 family phage prohead protease